MTGAGETKNPALGVRRDSPSAAAYTNQMAADGVLDVNGRSVTAARLADTRRSRARGLLGTRAGPVLVLPRTRSVHTVAMTYVLDVALCAADGSVTTILTMEPNRMSRPRRGVRTIVEAPAGSFERWGLRLGDVITIGPSPPRTSGP